MATMRDKLFPLLAWLFDGYWPRAERPPDGPPTLRGCKHTYTLQQPLTDGDTCDVLLATADAQEFLVKLARSPAGCAALQAEQQTLARLIAMAADTTYRAYLPILVESVRVPGRSARRANVFTFEPGWHTLEQLHEQHPALDGRHLAWIFNRLLTILGFVHRQGVIHGAVLPDHVLIHAPTHSLQLVGWGHGVGVGQRLGRLGARYRGWYPPEAARQQPVAVATDLYLAARCFVYLAGGDPLTNVLPAHVPAPLRRFVLTCLLDGVRMRPDDAWAVLDDFAQLLRQLYGPPRFEELALS